MQILVFVPPKEAIERAGDVFGALPVQLGMDELSQRQRETLAEMVSRNLCQALPAGCGRRQLPDKMGPQLYAPHVSRADKAALIEAIDFWLGAWQRMEYERAKAAREQAERERAEQAARVVKLTERAEQYLAGGKPKFMYELIDPVSRDSREKCPVCGEKFYAKEMRLTTNGEKLSEELRNSLAEYAQDKDDEALMVRIRKHVTACEAKQVVKKAQAVELEKLFWRFASDEQKSRYDEGFLPKREMRQVVADTMFLPVSGGERRGVQQVENIIAGDIHHDDSCDWDNSGVELHCTVVVAKHLTAQQFLFLQLVRSVILGHQIEGLKVKYQPRFVLCDCNQCAGWIIGYHVLVTMITSAGQEFSRRFESSDLETSRLKDAAVWNDHTGAE